MKRIRLSLVIVGLLLLLSSCIKEEIPKITVQFESNGGTPIASIELVGETPLNPPDNPMKEGYSFEGWFLSSELSELFDFNVVPENDITLYAGWKINQYTVTFLDEFDNYIYEVTSEFDSIINPPSVVPAFGYVLAGWENIADPNEVYLLSTMPAKNLQVRPKFKEEIFELPIFTIEIDRDIYEVYQEEYASATVSLINPNGELEIDHASGGIRGRGNGSWSYDKKSYRLKFDDEISLLGGAASRHWLLVPGGHDFSSLRSPAAYTIVNEVLEGIEYTTSVHFVEVYFNGNYHGVYGLFEHVRVGEGRVDIDSDYGVIDTGYLLEYDAYAYGIEDIDYFYIQGLKYPFALKSPDPSEYFEEISEEDYRKQVKYIKSYMQTLVTAILNKDYVTVLRLGDIDSIVDMYIIHELFKNTDTGWSSFYMYKKPGGKVFFGPAWDFDFTAGISRDDSSTEGLYVGDTVRYHSDFTSSEIYLSLMTQPLFVNTVKKRFLEIHDAIESKINVFFQESSRYDESFQRDGERWYWLSYWDYDQRALKEWLLERNDWLENWAKN